LQVRASSYSSNKSTNKCNIFSSLLLDVYVRLNVFRASSRPSSGAQQLQYQPLVLLLERGGSSAIGRGRAVQPDHDHFLTTLYNPSVSATQHIQPCTIPGWSRWNMVRGEIGNARVTGSR